MVKEVGIYFKNGEWSLYTNVTNLDEKIEFKKTPYGDTRDFKKLEEKNKENVKDNMYKELLKKLNI
ncbi:hypothetical protein [Gemella cuniculi]|uniref:hypothetical protein n=1 Tax=Gemella cuniculi TaxID=150240 RepID=UPI000400E0A0|nr:hypothetical protein [Gemella cuniculi]